MNISVNKPESGFTLIEIAVVLLILVALAGLAMPYISGTSSAALCKATDVSMQNVKKAIMERYYLDTLGYFPSDKGVGNDFNLKYLFIRDNGLDDNSDSTIDSKDAWQLFNAETQLGWRQGGYLQGGINIATPPNDSFKFASGNVHTDITGIQALDGWSNPLIIQVFCANAAYTTKSDCESHGEIWTARLVSAGSDAQISTKITDANRKDDDRILYLNAPTPSADINPSCDE